MWKVIILSCILPEKIIRMFLEIQKSVKMSNMITAITLHITVRLKRQF